MPKRMLFVSEMFEYETTRSRNRKTGVVCYIYTRKGELIAQVAVTTPRYKMFDCGDPKSKVNLGAKYHTIRNAVIKHLDEVFPKGYQMEAVESKFRSYPVIKTNKGLACKKFGFPGKLSVN